MDLSIIIVNWKSAEFLESCLATIYSTPSNMQFEVIVIDNASFDGAGKMIAERFGAVKFIQSTANLGFSGANNLAFEHSSGRNILFLNPDTEIIGNALDKMVSKIDSSASVGALGCKILNSDRSLQTSCVQTYPTVWNQFCDSEFLRSLFPSASMWGTGALSQESDVLVDVEVVSGACLMINRTVFEEVGQFSTAYFMYAEDADLCYKVKQTGLKVAYLGSARILHHGGGSSSQTLSRFSAVTMKRSIHQFIRIHQGRVNGWLYRACMAFAACVRLFLLGAGAVVTLRVLRNTSVNSSAAKWFSVLLWAIGLDSSRPSTVSGPQHCNIP